MLRHLLSRSELVKLELIEELNQNEPIFLDELAARLKQSPLLLKKYIDEINTDIDYIEITLDENKLIALNLSTYYSIANIYSLFLENSLAFQALERLFYKEYTTYELLADELLVSKSTVIRLIQQINDELAHLNFYIETKPLRMAGTEKNIRQFYTIYFLEKYHDADFLQHESLAPVMKELSFYLDRIIPLPPYFSDIQRITVIMYVITIRTRMTNNPGDVSLKNGSDMIELLGIEEFVQKETGAHIQHILKVLASHVFMDETLRKHTGDELKKVLQNIFSHFHYRPSQFQLHFSEILFHYMLGLNLSVPYCILDNRLERYHAAKTGSFYTRLLLNDLDILFKFNIVNLQ